MKAHLIDTHLLVPRSRSSTKVEVKYKGYISQKMAFSGAFVFHKHILFFVIVFFFLSSTELGQLSGVAGILRFPMDDEDSDED